MTKVMTVAGDLLDTFNPDPEHLSIEVIAHHLSNQCRYNGACRGFYSVAEHCLTGAHLARAEFKDNDLARAFMLHDAHEAFIGDIVTPMKSLLVDSPWWHAADALDLALQKRFNVSFDDPRIKQIDDHMLHCEWWYLMPDKNRYWTHSNSKWRFARIMNLSPEKAREAFLKSASDWWDVANDQ